ncbi:MAG: response regulator [Lachnospiraceae bacterium]|nr:response regulator [Lachnospiraceae bacterium]
MTIIKKKIVILLYQYSVVVKGIENRLKEFGYEVEILTGAFGNIRDYDPSSVVFLMYLPGDITDDERKMSILGEISQMVLYQRAGMIILGEKSFQAELIQKMPDLQRFEWENKPVDMDKLGSVLDNMFITLAGVSSDKRRILVVDDDPAYAQMVRAWIKHDFKVDVVTAGMQAISFLIKTQEKDPVDLILLDYEMPVVDGPQVLQMLRQEPATAKIPVVFLTGVGTKEAVGRVMELKPDGYILKSTTRADLLANLHKRLG